MSAITEATARGIFRVELQILPFEGVDDSAGLARRSIFKQFEGDLVANSLGQMLSAGSPATGSAGYVAIERVSGVLDGRSGSFALQHSGTFDQGKPSLLISVVPGSGTGELEGIRGQLAIRVEGGVHSYEFVYLLPATAVLD